VSSGWRYTCRAVLLGDDRPPHLTRRGVERLQEARDDHAFLRSDATSLTGTPDKAQWWTFAGLLANQRLAELLHATLGGATSATNFSITIHDAPDWAAIVAAIGRLSQESVVPPAAPPGTPPEAPPTEEAIAALRALPLKFRECLGDAMLARLHAARTHCAAAVEWVGGQGVVVVGAE